MSEPADGRTNRAAGERILVAVRDVGAARSGQGSLIDDIPRAERIVARLIEAGVEAEAVSALRARELPLRVTYRWVVELTEKGKPASGPRGGDPGPAAEWTRGLLAKAARFVEEATPDRPFQLRMDRVVWLGLWGFSLLILALSLLSSLSQGTAREFVVELPPASFEGAEAPGVALDSRTGPHVVPIASPAAALPDCMTDGVNECRCDDFATQAEAQAFYQRFPPGPGHVVDPDGNGAVCEWLPASAPGS